MALIDGNYVLAKSEKIPFELDVTENPVEEGIALTDHTERKSLELTLDCLILDMDDGTKAQDILEKLQKIQDEAKIVKYVGRNIFKGIITQIEKTDTHEIANGSSYSISMKEIRIAKSPFRPDLMQAAINAGLQQMANQNNNAVYHTVVRGDCLIRIAKKYGTTLDFIIKHNKIPSGNPNLIYPGEKYLVKEGSSKAATVNQSLRWVSVAEELRLRASGTSNSKKTSSSSNSSSSVNALKTAKKNYIQSLTNAYNEVKTKNPVVASGIYSTYTAKINSAVSTNVALVLKDEAMKKFNNL